MKDVEDFCPANQQEWRNWLEVNHKSKDAVWLIFYRKSSPKVNLGWSESVDEALCFGWIDSVKKTIDSESYRQYFSKRKKKSNWSKVNKEKIEILIGQGLMQAEGFKSIEIAKENGSWTILDGIEALEMPEALKQALENQKNAMEFFDSLSNSAKKILLYWVISAKREETIQKRIAEIAENAGNKMKPKQFR